MKITSTDILCDSIVMSAVSEKIGKRFLMDPNEILKELEKRIEANKIGNNANPNQRKELFTLCQNLRDWLKSGGFQPDWNSYPKASNYFMQRPLDA